MDICKKREATRSHGTGAPSEARRNKWEAKSNGKPSEATAPEPKARRKTSGRQKKRREAMGSHGAGAEIEARNANA